MLIFYTRDNGALSKAMAMALNPQVMTAVERLGYRVTVGDVASQAGLDVNLAQQGLLVLASEAKGHLQVAESGEVVYQFPKNFREILRNKSIRLQLQDWWNKVWRVLFYLIRISFGIVLVASIALIAVAIAIIIISMSATRDGDDRRDNRGGDDVWEPSFWFSDDFFRVFSPDPYTYSDRTGQSTSSEKADFNFLEAIFSFLFGDGNPNLHFEEQRWQTIGNVIRNAQGAVIAEQLAPYLDPVKPGVIAGDEDYILPVLIRFNGRPEVSPDGEIVYHFPDLQTTVNQGKRLSVAAYLKEVPWRFSRATSGQRLMAIGLGSVNLVGALVLGKLLSSSAATLGGFIGFVSSIYGLLLAYGIGFLVIPLVRYFWIQGRNRKITTRNDQRQLRAEQVNALMPQLEKKLGFARQFAAETVIKKSDLIYTTEEDLLTQEIEHRDRIDAEWQQRLERSGQP